MKLQLAVQICCSAIKQQGGRYGLREKKVEERKRRLKVDEAGREDDEERGV